MNPFFGGWVLLDLFGARFAGAGKDHSPVFKEEAFFGCEEGIRSTDDGAEGDSKKYFEGAAQSCSWKAKLPKVTPKIRKPTRVMMRSFPRRAQDFLSSRMSLIRFEGLLRRPSKR
ncbi:MAG: hypothetical protein ACKVKH_10680 [Verrucomicrobiales bacterium]